MTAVLPAQLLYIAAQFPNNVQHKEILTSINVKRKGNKITITSSDGYRAFRVSFDANDHYFMDVDELNIAFSPFKKRAAKARYITIRDNVAEFKDINGEVFVMYPIQHVVGTYPDMNNSIWHDTYENTPEAPIAFNAKLLSTFLTEVARFGSNKKVTIQTNKTNTPMQFNADIEIFGDSFEVFYLLMPMLIRN